MVVDEGWVTVEATGDRVVLTSRRRRPRETKMAQVYFHCSSAEEVLLDRRGSDVEDLTEARERAVGVVRRFISRPGPEDWREWVLHVSDGDGEEIFEMPFSSLVGRPH